MVLYQLFEFFKYNILTFIRTQEFILVLETNNMFRFVIKFF